MTETSGWTRKDRGNRERYVYHQIESTGWGSVAAFTEITFDGPHARLRLVGIENTETKDAAEAYMEFTLPNDVARLVIESGRTFTV